MPPNTNYQEPSQGMQPIHVNRKREESQRNSSCCMGRAPVSGVCALTIRPATTCDPARLRVVQTCPTRRQEGGPRYQTGRAHAPCIHVAGCDARGRARTRAGRLWRPPYGRLCCPNVPLSRARVGYGGYPSVQNRVLVAQSVYPSTA